MIRTAKTLSENALTRSGVALRSTVVRSYRDAKSVEAA